MRIAVLDLCYAVIKHRQNQFVDGDNYTNTIKGLRALLKRVWYGSHHHHPKKFTPLYLAEACYKYNHRKDSTVLFTFMQNCFP